MHNRCLFAYGTLKDKNILELVLGREYKDLIMDASLLDYKMYRNGYFYVLPLKGGSVPGIILNNLSVKDFDRLDMYENVDSGLYVRRTATASLGYTTIDTQIYVGNRIASDHNQEELVLV